MERRCFSLNIIYGVFFSFHYVCPYTEPREFLCLFEPDPTQGSRSTSGSCEIIKIFMAHFCVFRSGVKNHFMLLPCAQKALTNFFFFVDDKGKNMITMGVL